VKVVLDICKPLMRGVDMEGDESMGAGGGATLVPSPLCPHPRYCFPVGNKDGSEKDKTI
jgi:hypothetical protein